MRFSNDRLPGGSTIRTQWMLVALFITGLALTACSGSSGTSDLTATTSPPVAATCDPDDASTQSECGTLILSVTDADGDFDAYTVDIVSIQLEKASGAFIETLPTSTRVDFTQYVDLTEFVSVSSIPPGVYVGGSITLDYTDAEIFVEAGDISKEAVVVGADDPATPLGETTLEVKLSDRNRLLITRGRTALLTLDFDLEASHEVDIVPTPAVAVAEPFIVADVEPVESKDIRVRGRFLDANEAEMYYTVAVRPFHDRANDFGRIQVNVTDGTEFEVDGVMFAGAEGLRALEAAGAGTLTVAQGTLQVQDREFTANVVLAGSSVPGTEFDAVKGNVIARDGDVLTVRGATVFQRGLRPYYFRNVSVTLGPDTKVVKTGVGEADTGAISIGQNVSIRGDIDIDGDSILMDASEGLVRMNVTRLTGMVNSVVAGQVNVDLFAIDRKRIALFDFAGTGPSPADDALPEDYEVSTGNLTLAAQSEGEPVRVFGFPTAFGAAPPDFEGRTVIDYSDVRSSLGVGWGSDGTIAPFVMLDGSGLLLDNQNPDIDQRHYIKKGPVLIDLTSLASNTLIAPRETGRKFFVLKTPDSLLQYADFDDFTAALASELAAGSLARSMHAKGTYDRPGNTLTATMIGVHLIAP